MRHMGYYYLSLNISPNNPYGGISLKDSGIYQDDTGILNPNLKNQYYMYSSKGWSDLNYIKWKPLEEETVDKIQDQWENRQVLWLNPYNDEDITAITTIVKFRMTYGVAKDRDEVKEELFDGLKAIAWELFGIFTLDFQEFENNIEKYTDYIMEDMTIKDGTILRLEDWEKKHKQNKN